MKLSNDVAMRAADEFDRLERKLGRERALREVLERFAPAPPRAARLERLGGRIRRLRAKVRALSPETPMDDARVQELDAAIEAVLSLCGDVLRADVLGESRYPDDVRARYLIAAILRDRDWSWPQIGRALNRDHSTVLVSLRRWMADEEFKADVASLTKDIAAKASAPAPDVAA